MEEKHEKSNVSKLGYHIIWCPTFRHPILKDQVEVELKHVLGETCLAYGWTLHELEIMPDHVHCFIQAPPSIAPSEIASTLKSISAVKLFTLFPKLKQQKFWGTGLWSPSTYYASVGGVSEEAIRRYIQNQKTKG